MCPKHAGSLTWLGHGSLLLEVEDGPMVVVDPWLGENPSTPDEFRTIERADAILVTHGHFDHISDVPEVAGRTKAQIISTTEIVAYLASEGVEHLVEMNKGGSVDVSGVTITMVPADHSSGCPVEEGKPNVEGGSAVGFVFRGEFGSVYVSGDTGVFADMGTIRELYAPELGVIPIDGHFNMGPYEAAYACELLGIQRVFPYHWGTFPLLKGTPAELQEHLKARGSRCEVLDVSPGGSVPLGHL